MAYGKYNFESNEDKELAFDLRQVYAKIVGIHLVDVMTARKEKNYPVYLNALRELYLVVRHKIKSETDRKKYDKLIEDFAEFIKDEKVSKVFSGQINDDRILNKIVFLLNDIELFLWEKTDEANIYGGKFDDEGL